MVRRRSSKWSTEDCKEVAYGCHSVKGFFHENEDRYSASSASFAKSNVKCSLLHPKFSFCKDVSKSVAVRRDGITPVASVIDCVCSQDDTGSSSCSDKESLRDFLTGLSHATSQDCVAFEKQSDERVSLVQAESGCAAKCVDKDIVYSAAARSSRSVSPLQEADVTPTQSDTDCMAALPPTNRTTLSTDVKGSESTLRGFFVVCDGHDGSLASEFVTSNLESAFRKVWASLNTADLFMDLAYRVYVAYHVAFFRVERAFRNTVTRKSYTSQRPVIINSAGACVVSVAVIDDFIFCANLGDSGATLLTIAPPNIPPTESAATQQESETDAKLSRRRRKKKRSDGFYSVNINEDRALPLCFALCPEDAKRSANQKLNCDNSPICDKKSRVYQIKDAVSLVPETSMSVVAAAPLSLCSDTSVTVSVGQKAALVSKSVASQSGEVVVSNGIPAEVRGSLFIAEEGLNDCETTREPSSAHIALTSSPASYPTSPHISDAADFPRLFDISCGGSDLDSDLSFNGSPGIRRKSARSDTADSLSVLADNLWITGRLPSLPLWPKTKKKVLALQKACWVDDIFQFHWLSTPHRACMPLEAARIASAGGKVEHGRISGLEPSRTIGDFDVKDEQPLNVLSAVPEITCVRVSQPGLLIVASDGIWDTLDCNAIVSLLRKHKQLWSRICPWLLSKDDTAKETGREGKSLSSSKTTADCKAGKCSLQDDLCTLARLLSQRGMKDGGDDCTCIVVYVGAFSTSA